MASKAHQSSFNRTWRSNQSLLVTEINLSCLERWCNSPCIVLYLTPSPACDGAACGDSGDPQKLASVQVNSGVTKRRRGWRLALNRDGGGCRVTCTCARTTCPDGIHLHTKKKNKKHTTVSHLTQHVGQCRHVWRGRAVSDGTVGCTFPPWRHRPRSRPPSPASSCEHPARIFSGWRLGLRVH